MYSYPRALQKLRVACERVKRNLSSNLQVPLEIDSLVEGVGLYTIITRTQFENLCESVLNRTLNTLRQILEVTSIERSAIDEIVMVGGASQIPYISTLVKDFFGGKTLKYLDPDSATVSGATTFAAILSPPAIDLPLLLLDATSLALGVETAGGAMTVVVRQHATLPTKKTGSFTTVSDNQPGVSIRIYEGNCARTKDNEFLGRLELWGIPPAPRGIPQIDVTFDLNNKGLDMTIRAELRGTGESTSLTLNRGRLARDVVNRMEWELRRSRGTLERVFCSCTTKLTSYDPS